MGALRRALRHVRAAAHEPSLRLAWLSACALYVTWPLFASAGQLNEFRDAQVLQNYELVAVKSVLEHTELPLWNPYACGGMYALGTPQSRFAAPPFLLSLSFGALEAAPLIAFFMTVLGMEGFFRFARTRAGSALGSALIAPLFGAHGYLPWSYFNGWLNFYGFLLLPWVLYGVDLAARGKREAPLVLGVAFAFIVGFGGTYAAPIGALLACAQAARCLAERGVRRALVRALTGLALAAYVALCLSAFRLWPVVESLLAAPRIMAGQPKQPLASLARMAFELATPRGHNLTREGQMFVGLTVLPLVALGLLRVRSLVALALAALCVWAAMGYEASPSAFAALRDLPVLSALRYPQRFLFAASLFAFEAAALGLDAIVRASRRRAWLAAPILVIAALLVGHTLVRERADAQGIVQGMWLSAPPLRIVQSFRQARGNRWLAAHYPAIDRGSIACWEAYPVPMSPKLRSDLPSEEYLADASAGTLKRLSFSPNHLELAVSLSRPTRVIVNQNHHPGWKSSVGRVVSHEGLLAVDMPAGTHQLGLRFRPRSALGGFAISLLALLGALALALGSTRAGHVLFAACPFALMAALWLVPEPAMPPPRLTNADGSPLFTNALPAHARRIDARFTLPVALVGASAADGTDVAGMTRVTTYWRVSGALPRDVGITLHFESSLGRSRKVEHEVVGASMFLADAPHDRLLRDVTYVPLATRPFERWKVYVSLSEPSGSNTRVAVQAKQGLEISQQRVLALEL